MDAQLQTPPALMLLDLPEAVLADILSRCGPADTRTGIHLPLVCKAFRGVLSDLRHVRLWGMVAPLSSIPQHVMPDAKKWPSLQEWLQLRGSVTRTLHIRHPCPIWDSRLPCAHAPFMWLYSMRGLVELVIDLPGPRLHMTAQVTGPLASLSQLQCLQLSMPVWESNWQWLRNLQRLTSLHLSNHGDGSVHFEFEVLEHMTMLREVTIRLYHNGDVSPLSGLSALRSLTLTTPDTEELAEKQRQHLESLSGLISLKKLWLVQPDDSRDDIRRYLTLPLDVALRRLTRLTCLHLHELIPADGPIQSSITKLLRLAQLRVGGSHGLCELSPGFGGLDALTSLIFCKVHFRPATPLQSGLGKLRVLQLADCWGPLCIACALPALQRISITEARNLELLPAFLSALGSQPNTCCELAEVIDAWISQQLPPVAQQLPRLHCLSVVVELPPEHAHLRVRLLSHELPVMPLGHLESLDLQGCGLYGIPPQLGAAKQLRRLRIAEKADGFSFKVDDLDTFSAMHSLTFLSAVQSARADDEYDSDDAFDDKQPWNWLSLQSLCCILWELRARSLTVVLKEPSDVVVPLAVAAAFPADALGRCALTTAAMADRFQDTAPMLCSDDGDNAGKRQWAWLNALCRQQREARPEDVAEVDGAAAMWAAVPADVMDWLQLQADARM